MSVGGSVAEVDYVALRKESVDRNLIMYRMNCNLSESLSARRAWIEMSDVR